MILLRKILNDFGFHLTFHNIGQGLFYTGVVNYKNNQYSFVFDCGSNTLIKDELDKRISKFKEKLLNDTVHLLIISHFHEDHINGLDILLRDTTVKTVVMPYMTLTERLLVACTSINRFSRDWYFEFLIDPVNFIMDRGKVQQIILIGRGEDNFSDGENLVFPDEPRDFNPELPFDHSKLGDERGNEYLYNKILNENPNWKNLLAKKKLIPKTHNGYGLLAGLWFFRFFNLKKSIPNLNFRLKHFEDCLKRQLGVKDLKDIDKNIFLREICKQRNGKIKFCYEEAFGRKNRLNLTSVSVFHIPILTKAFYDIICCSFLWKPCTLLHKCYKLSSNKTGQILTGDLDLKTKSYLNEFNFHFSKFVDKTYLFQVPHHGSVSNWNNRLLNIFSDTPFWIICAGMRNRYNHPHWSVVLDLLENDKHAVLVNEKYSLITCGRCWLI